MKLITVKKLKKFSVNGKISNNLMRQAAILSNLIGKSAHNKAWQRCYCYKFLKFL